MVEPGANEATSLPGGAHVPEQHAKLQHRSAWRHVGGSAVVLLLVFALRWAFSLEFATARFVGMTFTLFLMVVGLVWMGRWSRASTAWRQCTMILVVGSSFLLAGYSPLAQERWRILDEVPISEGGQRLSTYTNGFLCTSECHVGETLHYDGSVKEVFGAQRNMLANSDWAVYEDSYVFGDPYCLEQSEQCNLRARQGRIHLGIQVRPDPNGAGSIMALSIAAF